jgi:integrin beta 3
VAALESRQAERGEKGDPGRDGSDGKDGRDGIDGAPGQAGADGINGKDGAAGADGRSVTLEEVRAYLDTEVATWALNFERRAQDILQRAIDRIPAPKDGKDGSPGKDGRDGVSFDEFHVEQIDDRTVRETWSKGGVVVRTFDRKVRAPIYREIYRQGERYDRDDMVTFGGSVWCALRDTDSKPGRDDSWRLAVKARRDGSRRDGP